MLNKSTLISDSSPAVLVRERNSESFLLKSGFVWEKSLIGYVR